MYWANSEKHRNTLRGGFSFIELMVVVVIIGILAAAVTLSTTHFMDKAKTNRARSDLSTFKSALAAFYAENGRYPTNDEGLASLAPKFIEKVHNDPWGRAYQYNQPGRVGPYEIICLGSAGTEGGGNISSDNLDEPPADPAKASP
jgi:general secretion pathway protein G